MSPEIFKLLQKEMSEVDPHLDDPIIPEFSMTIDFSKGAADITIKNIPIPTTKNSAYVGLEDRLVQGLDFDSGIKGRTKRISVANFDEEISSMLEDAVIVGIANDVEADVVVHPSSLMTR